MTLEVVCTCGRTLKAPASAAGRKGRCKGCGAVLTIPIPNASYEVEPSYAPAEGAVKRENADDSEAYHPVTVFPTAPVAAVSPPPTVVKIAATNPDSDSHVPILVPPEPWYYRFLELFAQIIMVFGLLAPGLLCAVGVFVLFFDDRAAKDSVPTGLIFLGAGAAAAVPVLLVSAPILLAVDAARNLRAIRHAPRRSD